MQSILHKGLLLFSQHFRTRINRVQVRHISSSKCRHRWTYDRCQVAQISYLSSRSLRLSRSCLPLREKSPLSRPSSEIESSARKYLIIASYGTLSVFCKSSRLTILVLYSPFFPSTLITMAGILYLKFVRSNDHLLPVCFFFPAWQIYETHVNSNTSLSVKLKI